LEEVIVRTRIVWLLVGVGLTIMVSQAWAKTLGRSKAGDETRSFTKETREYDGNVTNRRNPTCKRGLQPGDPQYGKPSSSGYRTADGTSKHRFDCAVRPSCCNVSGSGTLVQQGGSSYVRISLSSDLTNTQPRYVVVTMKHKRNMLGQASYPVSARKANCSQERCVNPY
jgi:hypothetical protein